MDFRLFKRILESDNRNVGLTTKPETLSGSGALNLESRGISYFGRASYSLLNRYILTATLRRDGSSNFGAATVGVPSFRSFGMARVRRSFHAESGRGFQPEAPSWLGTNR